MLKAFALGTLVLVGAMAGAAATRGACDGPAPSFANGVQTAGTLVIGEVIAAGPPVFAPDSFSFSLRVDHVLRGDAPDVMKFKDLVLQPCAGWVTVRMGDVIALALGANEFGGEVNPVAFIRGSPPRADIERLSMAEVFAMAGTPAPDTAAEPFEVPWGFVALAGVLAAATALIVVPRRDRV